MAKVRTQFLCSDCGGASAKWEGRCPHCGAWNTLQETRESPAAPTAHRYAPLAASTPVRRLADIEAREQARNPTGIEEFDRVLGGGLVAGAVVLIGGDPGIGKSTLLLQALASLSERGPVLYVTGEESAEQVALRAQRLGVSGDGVDLLAEIRLEQITQALVERQPGVAVIDSIQTLYSGELTAAPGSVSQVRECAAQLTRIAKQTGVTLILIGHVTKDGALAGPRVLEHIVDTVLYFEGDTHSSFRLVRAIKNRFGAVNELGVFAMTDRGLRGVSNPSALFLAGHSRDVAGSCVMATQEGTRPLLVEVQALVDTAHMPSTPPENPIRPPAARQAGISQSPSIAGLSGQHAEHVLDAVDGLDAQALDGLARQIGARHDGVFEAQLGGFAQAFLAARGRADLAGQTDLAEGQQAGRQGAVAHGREDRQGHGQVGGRLHDAHAADGVDEDVLHRPLGLGEPRVGLVGVLGIGRQAGASGIAAAIIAATNFFMI